METGKGIHFHVFGIAIVDTIATILGGWGIAYYMKWPIPLTIFGLFILGIIAHRLFNVPTTIDRLLFK
jgi:hypothetical protein